MLEDRVERHWNTIELTDRQQAEVRRIVWQHIDQVLPTHSRERREATERIDRLNSEASKLLQAYYVDAITSRPASDRAGAHRCK